MGRPPAYTVTWTPRAIRQLASLLNDSRHDKDNLPWRQRKALACYEEARQRLATFPDLRDRYFVDGILGNALTLRAFPAQIMYREVGEAHISVYFCRWAKQDTTGPQAFNRDGSQDDE